MLCGSLCQPNNELQNSFHFIHTTSVTTALPVPHTHTHTHSQVHLVALLSSSPSILLKISAKTLLYKIISVKILPGTTAPYMQRGSDAL